MIQNFDLYSWIVIFPVGTFEGEGQLAVEALVCFKGIISSVYLPLPLSHVGKSTADGLTYEHQDVFYSMIRSQAWRDLNGSRFNQQAAVS